MVKKRVSGLKRKSKLNVWLKYYLDQSNPATFLNKKESARAAGYKNVLEETLAAIGSQNYLKLRKKIEQWFDEEGLSENALKIKLLSLLDAKETKFFADKGIVTDQREVKAYNVQRSALDMAFKIKGMYAPERHNVNVKHVSEMSVNDLEAIIIKDYKKIDE